MEQGLVLHSLLTNGSISCQFFVVLGSTVTKLRISVRASFGRNSRDWVSHGGTASSLVPVHVYLHSLHTACRRQLLLEIGICGLQHAIQFKIHLFWKHLLRTSFKYLFFFLSIAFSGSVFTEIPSSSFSLIRRIFITTYKCCVLLLFTLLTNCHGSPCFWANQYANHCQGLLLSSMTERREMLIILIGGCPTR